jgi:hypothetical protein
MAERTNAQLLKSCEVQASVGSNPTPSAAWADVVLRFFGNEVVGPEVEADSWGYVGGLNQ